MLNKPIPHVKTIKTKRERTPVFQYLNDKKRSEKMSLRKYNRINILLLLNKKKKVAKILDTVKIDGFTPDQRFFISVAQIWQSKKKPEAVRNQVNTDPHSPAEWRVLGPLTHFTPFYQAFALAPGSKLFVSEDKRLKIW